MSTDTKRTTITNLLKNFLTEGGDLKELKTVTKDLESLITTESKLHTAVVTTAIPLSKADQDAVTQAIALGSQKDLAYEFQVDPEVLGGLRIQINDEIYDLTVAQTLEALTNRLKQWNQDLRRLRTDFRRCVAQQAWYQRESALHPW